jgi:hypothetical protein
MTDQSRCPACDHEQTWRGPCTAYIDAVTTCNCYAPWHQEVHG